VVTNESGQVLSRLAYAPYGEQVTGKSRGTDTTTRKYAGYELDEESGLHLAGARYYDTRTARFLTPDSVTPGGGQRPQGWNRYAYSRNNPITFMDPSGHLEGPFTNSLHDFWEHGSALAGGVAKWAADAGVGFVAGLAPVPAPLGKAPFGNERTMGVAASVGAAVGLYLDLQAGSAGFVIGGGGAVAACATGVACPTVGVGAATAGATVVVAAAAVGAIHVANFAEGVKHAMSEGEQQVAGSGSGAAGSGGHFSGSEKPRTSGATPNSIYTHVDPKTGKATQNAIYDGNGNVVGHVDFKNHGDGAPSGHGHMFPEPGNPASGHGPGKPHIPNDRLPPGWDKLPPNVKPNTPIGD
jgi:RHS repeat-associated protein